MSLLERASGKPEPDPPTSHHTSHPVHLLLVEKDRRSSASLREMLARAAARHAFRLHTVECHQLSRAVQHAAALGNVVIIVDFSCPEQHTLEYQAATDDMFACVQHHAAGMPVIVLTYQHDEERALRALEAGAADYLIKEYLAQEPQGSYLLRRSVRYVLQQHQMCTESQRSEARLRTIIEHNADGMLIVDRNGVVCFMNPAAEALLGRSAGELTGEVFGFPLAGGETIEIDVVRRGNGICSAEMRVVETYWNDDVAYLASLRDITDRKQVEAEIRHLNSVLEQRVSERTTQLAAANHELQNEISERKSTEQILKDMTEQLTRSRNLLRTIFDSVDDGLLLLDNEGCVLALNQSLATLLGGSVPELVDQPWSALCERTEPPFPGMWVLKTLRDRRARRRREHHSDIVGPSRTLDMQALPVLAHDNTLDQVVVHVVDVTEQLQWEHLAIQNERFVASDRLAAAMAHEVNTPLQSIQNCLYLTEKSNEERRIAYLMLARDEIDRIGRIVQRLLDLHHPVIDTGQMININMLIERLVLLTGSTLARHGIEVACHMEHDLPSFWGQHDQLTQVLLNIILNAMDAMPDGGKLTLRTSTYHRSPRTETGPLARRLLTIEISDTGCGISPAHQGRIFEPFFTTKSEGSGLGLAISHKIIMQHGGDVTVQSVPEQGTTFTIVFPLTDV